MFGFENTMEFIEFVPDRLFNDFRYSINFDKLKNLGWSSKITFEQGLKLTIDWYKNLDSTHWKNVDSALVAHPRLGQ